MYALFRTCCTSRCVFCLMVVNRLGTKCIECIGMFLPFHGRVLTCRTAQCGLAEGLAAGVESSTRRGKKGSSSSSGRSAARKQIVLLRGGAAEPHQDSGPYRAAHIITVQHVQTQRSIKKTSTKLFLPSSTMPLQLLISDNPHYRSDGTG